MARFSVWLSTAIVMRKPAPDIRGTGLRHRTIVAAARELGLLGGENGRIGGHVRRGLIAAAKKKSGDRLRYRADRVRAGEGCT